MQINGSPLTRPSARSRVGHGDPPRVAVPLSLLFRVLNGLRALPNRRPPHGSTDLPPEDRTPLVRLIDAQRARTVADRTPTQEIPVVVEGVSWW